MPLFETLQCDFTPEQKQELQANLVNAELLLCDLEEIKGAQSSTMIAQIKTTKANIKAYARKIKQGFEDRLVEVLVLMDTPEPGKKTVVRTDTNERLRVMAMTLEEQQQSFNFGGDKK